MSFWAGASMCRLRGNVGLSPGHTVAGIDPAAEEVSERRVGRLKRIAYTVQDCRFIATLMRKLTILGSK